ncbi:PREDICTED: 1,2-dihydroxy-3-keto-5-methylthiopentene dioxygenase 2-like [Populus euphratica]|uniref:acireductone dioxygenase (Fe(2+)-requiring) n=1 Tax=Populus euphratica TaxID=75702 RepID=A0AAJ6UJG5_POPEU|nr:PREDICTED: 1,2-dihydroxy-3-keto-5-methylthiopentene dioxygenase 2-like [Populus euphratica]
MIVTKTRLPHHREPNEFVFGPAFCWRLDADGYETDEELKKIREERGYSCVDFCEGFPEKLPNYEEKIKNIFEEHFHTDEEIRNCVAGSGYFDVRDHNDRWIRVWVKKGGMIVLLDGIYQVVYNKTYARELVCGRMGKTPLFHHPISSGTRLQS